MKRDSWIIQLFKKLVKKSPPRSRDIRVQRMCPFCKLITPTYRVNCLECGKILSPA